jgi:hypothetical protein
MPGEQEDQTRIPDPPLPSYVDVSLLGAVARFRDAAGVHWLIRPDGHLAEEPRSQTGTPSPHIASDVG